MMLAGKVYHVIINRSSIPELQIAINPLSLIRELIAPISHEQFIILLGFREVSFTLLNLCQLQIGI
jgi:hypothetical protein